MDTIFYYYYLFYKWTKVETQPVLTAWFAISFSESFFTMGFSEFISNLLFEQKLNKYIFMLVMLVPLVINYYIYIKKRRANKIIKAKPKILNSHYLSIFIAWSFFILTFVSWIFLSTLIDY